MIRLKVPLKWFVVFLLMMLSLPNTGFSQNPNFHIYLCFGQSNMEGSALIEEQDKAVDSRFSVMASANCEKSGRVTGNWYRAVPPLSQSHAGLSPADYFGRTMAGHLPDSISIGIVSVAVGGCDIRLFDKDLYLDYDSMYGDWFIEKVKAYGGNPYQRLVELGRLAQKEGVIKGFLLHQGETNTGDENWPKYVEKVYHNLLNDLGLAADEVPLLAGEVVHADQDGTCAAMNAIINRLPQTITTAHVVSSRGCGVSEDMIHFNSAGVRELGKRYALKMLGLNQCLNESASVNKREDFIQINGTQFIRNGRPYRFIGTNFWYGMNLGAYDKARLERELDRLKEIGVTNLRVMAASEGHADAQWRMQPCLQTAAGIFDEDLLVGLDVLLAEMRKRDMLAVVCLNNFWPWSGGMSQYVSWANNNEPIPFPPPAKDGDWCTYQEYTAQFYTNSRAMRYFDELIAKIVLRRNSVNGLEYKNDPTIMAWQLANEPEGVNQPVAYRKWVRQTAKHIKQLDANHLVSIGSEGNTPFPQTGNNFLKDHRSRHIDYCTFHLWVQNWGLYDPANPETSMPVAMDRAKQYIGEHVAIAKQLNKPIVLEEFGISRDFNNHDHNATTRYRDVYYAFVFSTTIDLAQASKMAGANFWAWGGEGRPRFPEAIWKTGDELIGDPPNEKQGWYSVYDTDESTQKIIHKYSLLISK